MRKHVSHVVCLVLVSAGFGYTAGCADNDEWNRFWQGNKKASDEKPAADVTIESEVENLNLDSYAFKDTVGSYCYMTGSRKLRVRGYGLVVGLGTNGSRQCPEYIRKSLVQEIRKRRFSQAPFVVPRDPISPEDLIDSEDTAVIFVQGAIPAYAVKDSTFDVSISALPGTDVKSLEGGRLYTADLRRFATSGDGSVLEGKVLAHAEGPVFLNPFGQKPGAVTKTRLLRARIIRGATLNESRKFSLSLLQPSYQYAIRIAKRINDRFPASTKIADPMSNSKVELTVPHEFQATPSRFVDLARHLFVPRPPGFEEERTRKLAEEILSPDAPHGEIAVCFEAMGKNILPMIRPLYEDRRHTVNYYAARSGLRLLDEPAVDVIIRHATSTRSPYRRQAVAELGKVNRFRRITDTLESLLEDEDPRIRLAAVHALDGHRTDRIHSRMIGKDNFRFDLVTSSATPLIYATTNNSPRIAVFSPDLQCAANLFYAHRDDALIISSRAGDPNLVLVRKTPYLKIISEPIPVSRSISELIPMLGERPEIKDSRVKGVGMNYSQVLEILSTLCENHGIPARFTLQQPSVKDLYKPVRFAGRPESTEL